MIANLLYSAIPEGEGKGTVAIASQGMIRLNNMNVFRAFLLPIVCFCTTKRNQALRVAELRRLRLISVSLAFSTSDDL